MAAGHTINGTASADPMTVWTEWTGQIRRRTTAGLVAIVVAGTAMVLVSRNGPPTVAGLVLVGVTVVGFVLGARPPSAQSVGCAVAAAVFGAWLVLRTSAWLLPLDVLAAMALLALAAALARGGSLLDLSVLRGALHASRFVANALVAPGYLFVRNGVPGKRTAIVRGLLLALPLAIVVGALLASADAVFASAFRFGWGDIVVDASAFVAGAWGMAALLRLASAAPAKDIEGMAPRLGATEWTIIVGSLDLLLGWFAVARLFAATEGGRRVIETAGLTYAEYARSGFFQLIAATILSLGALLALRPLVEPSQRRRFVVMAEVALALLLVVVVQALQRLALYERAFGLTMPRLFASAACVGLGLVLVAAGLWFGGLGGRRHWFWTAAGAALLAVLLALNAINAEALVVRRNAARAERVGEFDAAELAYLGDDALPAVVDVLQRLPEEDGEDAKTWLCRGRDDRHEGPLSYNAAREAAERAARRACRRATL